MGNQGSGRKKLYKRLRLEHWQVISLYLGVYDVLTVNAAYFFALWFRFDCGYGRIPSMYMTPYLLFIPVYSVVCILVFRWLRLYNSIWRFASYSELIRVTVATGITAAIHTIGITAVCRFLPANSVGRMPISYYFFGVLIQFMLTLAIRFAYRFVLAQRSFNKVERGDDYARRVMLIGAGEAGQMILRDMHKAKEIRDRVCCIIDDNSNKWNRYIDGIPVVGGRYDIIKNVEKYHIDKIYVAIPSATPAQRREILTICSETGCELKNLPGMYQLMRGEVSAREMRQVDIADLLGREPVEVNVDEILQSLRDKVILVTGGGGSIGSELCRQIAGHMPKQLIIVDVYENNAYDIQQELKRQHPELNLAVLIASVRDSRRINDIFEEYRPDIVFHAAAHKHVPLMEDSPAEAIKNNAIGTYKTAYAAMMNGCRRFVLISTDKAVNPTNVMGASKRLCEMIIQSFDKKIKESKEWELPLLYTHADDGCSGEKVVRIKESVKTEFVAVRFGNVLGSNGSVIPLFRKQIEAGGPVTVTHPDIIRYFMTIPEAVSLVLQAGIYARGGEIFVLDMGAPVKIDTLARNLIRLSGYKPDVDIKIEYVGLRPGEKLYEEKLMAEEGLKTTANRLIHIGKPIPFDTDEFLRELRGLMLASYEGNSNIREMLAEVVPTYHPAGGRTSEHEAVTQAS